MIIKLSPKRPKTTKTKAAVTTVKPAPAAKLVTPRLSALTANDFAIGQKWKLEVGHAEVVHVGKILIDYRYYRVPDQKRVGVETKTMREFCEALKRNKAKLMA